MDNRRAVAVIAALVFVVGLVLGLLPVSIDRGVQPVPCGSAFAPNTDEAESITRIGIGDTDYGAACADSLSTRRWIAIPILGAAAVVGAFALLTAGASTSARTSPARQ